MNYMNIDHVIAQLSDIQDELQILINKLEKLEKTEPEGRLGVRHCRKYVQYYQLSKETDKGGKYLNKNSRDTVVALAQKQYNHILKEEVETEKDAVGLCISLLSNDKSVSDRAMSRIPEELRSLIDSDVLTDKDFVNRWKKDGPMWDNPMEMKTYYTTPTGLKVRSKTEYIIAESLRNAGVPFHYEKQLDSSFGIRSGVYPDFTCLNKRTGKTYYWEHFGLMDDPKYSFDAIQKIQNYAAKGYYLGTSLIVSFETSKMPVRTNYINEMIQQYLV